MTTLFLTVIPFLLIGLIAFQRQPDRLRWTMTLLAFGLMLSFMWASATWELPGDTVVTETIIGQVGNSGNTSEPHLHIHAERGGEPGGILDGSSVPITINGRFLVRGNVLKS